MQAGNYYEVVWLYKSVPGGIRCNNQLAVSRLRTTADAKHGNGRFFDASENIIKLKYYAPFPLNWKKTKLLYNFWIAFTSAYFVFTTYLQFCKLEYCLREHF